MAHSYEIGTRAWQPDVEEGWTASEVEEKRVDGEKVTLVFRLANGEVRLDSRIQKEKQTLIYTRRNRSRRQSPQYRTTMTAHYRPS